MSITQFEAIFSFSSEKCGHSVNFIYESLACFHHTNQVIERLKLLIGIQQTNCDKFNLIRN
jgi:hypothetical protein